MAKARQIVKRRRAVQNIRKITRTMELIATARFKRAMDRAVEAAAYTRKISEIVADLSRARLDFSHPLLEAREPVQTQLVLVLTANRGLCGGYNVSILREAEKRIREIQHADRNLILEVSGKRGLSYMRFRGQDVDRRFTQFEDRPAFDAVEELADRYIDWYVSGKIDRLDVAYMKFESSSRQNPEVATLLPIGSLAGDDGKQAREEEGREVEYEFLPSAQEILQDIVPAAFKARLFKCFLDAGVSEQIARMVAMKGATENADDMIGTLTRQYNRARQTQITSELAEIVGGAAALE